MPRQISTLGIGRVTTQGWVIIGAFPTIFDASLGIALTAGISSIVTTTIF
jgi:hypothetical protein